MSLDGSQAKPGSAVHKPAVRVSPRKAARISAAAIGLLSLGVSTFGLASTAWGSSAPSTPSITAGAIQVNLNGQIFISLPDVAWN